MKFKFLLLWLLCSISVVFAFNIPQNTNRFVLDQAQVLKKNEAALLLADIQKIEAKTTSQIAIYIFDSLEGKDISSLAVEVGRAWGVGQATSDNGIIILVAINNRKWFISTGYGVEGSIPDALAKRIGERHFPFHFRNENYYLGLKYAIKDLEALLIKDPIVISQYAKKEAIPNINRRFEFFSMMFLLFLVLFVCLLLRKLKGANSRQSSLDGFNDRKSSSSRGSSFGGGSFGGGSFGGGSFGGGGAGGSW